MLIKTKLLLDIEMETDDDLNTEETIRYCVEQDLLDAGFFVNNVEIVE